MCQFRAPSSLVAANLAGSSSASAARYPDSEEPFVGGPT
jgi:hypothetical protein